MKYTICAAALAALLSAPSSTSAVQLKFTDDLVKSLAEDMAADANATPEETKTEKPPAKPAALAEKEKKTAAKTDKKQASTKKGKAAAAKGAAKKTEKKVEKKEDDNEIPMDASAIKAYSSVIADAAEDSEPTQPVVYTKTIPDEPKEAPHAELDFDPMGSMIQNEISSIKTASIKAANDNQE